LFTDQVQFPHQASHLEPPHLLAVFLHQRHDAAATGGASTLRKQFVDSTAQPKPLNVLSSAPEADPGRLSEQHYTKNGIFMRAITNITYR
jgi:hypothetical protein